MNKEKLTDKHICPYLPYGLKVTNGNETVEITVRNIDMLLLSQDFKPILRPLSDLTKEEYFSVWKFEMDEESLVFHFLGLDYESRFLDKYSLSFWNDLLSKHFDIFDLIPKGLAIDINSLPKN